MTDILEYKKCLRCGKEFGVTRKTKAKKYCCYYCGMRIANEKFRLKKRDAARLKPVTEYSKNCDICGLLFKTIYETQKVCSIACRKKKDNRRTSNGKIASGIKKIPCEYCGFMDLRAINRHHLNIAQGNRGGVICLCANCHSIYHAIAGKRSKASSKEEVLKCLKEGDTF
jgi:DNA-directed RNA polymerase subunit RPC12/RpoP